jgi:hypothetical protein
MVLKSCWEIVIYINTGMIKILPSSITKFKIYSYQTQHSIDGMKRQAIHTYNHEGQ